MTGFTIKNNVVYLGRKRLGTISWGEKTFRTWRLHSKHYFRMYEGWGVNYGLLKYLEKKGIKWIEVHDREYDIVYKTELKKLLYSGIYYKNNKHERDGQMVLPVHHWQTTVKNPGKLKKLIKMYGGR